MLHMKLKFQLVKWVCFLVVFFIFESFALELCAYDVLLLLFYNDNSMFLSVILCELCVHLLFQSGSIQFACQLFFNVLTFYLFGFFSVSHCAILSLCVSLTTSSSASSSSSSSFILFNVSKWRKCCYKSFLQRINLSSWRLRFKWLILNWINILRHYKRIYAAITVIMRTTMIELKNVLNVRTLFFVGIPSFCPPFVSRFLLAKYVY